MAPIVPFPPKPHIYEYRPFDHALSDGIAAVALTIARELYETNVLTSVQLSAALRAPISAAAVLTDVCRWFGVETPDVVEDALR